MLKYLVVISFYFMVSNSMLEYGEFDVKLTKFETCKGPKRKNCAEIVTRIVNDVFLDFDLNIKEAMKTVKGKIIGWLNDKVLFRLDNNNMCDHIFLRPLMQSFLNNSDHCAIEKGRFHVNVDIQALDRSFYGGKYIYGDWKFKWILHNAYCNLHCGVLYVSMTPKGFGVGDKKQRN